MIKLDNKTKIIIGVVVLGIAIFYFLKIDEITDEKTNDSKSTTLMRALSGQQKNIIMTDPNGNMSTNGVGKIDELKVGNSIELTNNGSLFINTPQGTTAFNDMNQTNINGTRGLNFIKGDLLLEKGTFTHGKFYTEPSSKGVEPINQRFVIRHRRGNAWTVFDKDDNTNEINGTTRIAQGNLTVDGNSLKLGQWEFKTCEIQPDQGGGGFLQILYKDQPIAKFGTNSVFSVGTNVEDKGRDDWRAWRTKKCA